MFLKQVGYGTCMHSSSNRNSTFLSMMLSWRLLPVDTLNTAVDLRINIQRLSCRDPGTHLTTFESQFKVYVACNNYIESFLHSTTTNASALNVLYLGA